MARLWRDAICTAPPARVQSRVASLAAGRASEGLGDAHLSTSDCNQEGGHLLCNQALHQAF